MAKAAKKPGKETYSDADDAQTIDAIQTRYKLNQAKANSSSRGGPNSLTSDGGSSSDSKSLQSKWDQYPEKIRKRIDGTTELKLGEAARKRIYGDSGAGPAKAAPKKNTRKRVSGK
jgi:hypothetical protein